MCDVIREVREVAVEREDSSSMMGCISVGEVEVGVSSTDMTLTTGQID